MGSIHGTYLKVFKDQSQAIFKGENYLIGTDIYFNIVDIQYPTHAVNSEEVFEDFYQYLAREYASSTKIYGIDKTKLQEYATTNQNQTIVHSEVLAPYPYSLLKIDVITSGGNVSTKLFVIKMSEEKEYVLGRAENCDIVIS